MLTPPPRRPRRGGIPKSYSDEPPDPLQLVPGGLGGDGAAELSGGFGDGLGDGDGL